MGPDPMSNKHGGARDGAGKPRRGKERRMTISITIDPDVLMRLDKATEGSSRSALIEVALLAYLPPAALIDIADTEQAE